MTATKKIILEKAIELFNNKGFAAVSMRDIAEATRKSVGNITYHYNRKIDLVRAIVKLQFEDMKNLDLDVDVDLLRFNAELKQMLDFQRRYFFYFSNIIELRNADNEISELQAKVRNQLTVHFQKVFKNFEEKGLFRPSSDDRLLQGLARGIVLLMMFWIQETSQNESARHNDLLRTVWGVLHPKLTAKGIARFDRIADGYPPPPLTRESSRRGARQDV